MSEPRFTGRQITTMVGAVCLAVAVVAPTGVQAAAGVFTQIADGTNTGLRAKVNGQGGLGTTAVDPLTGKQARVDGTGRLAVGDGGGPMTVDGSVRPQPPAAPFSGRAVLAGDADFGRLVGPSVSAINITSLTLTALPAPGQVISRNETLLLGQLVTAGLPCPAVPPSAFILFDAAVSTDAPVVQSFPTPLQYRPPAGKAACVYAKAFHSVPVGPANISVSGYLGS